MHSRDTEDASGPESSPRCPHSGTLLPRNDRRVEARGDPCPFKCSDLFAYNDVNVDALTETYGLAFYLQYLGTWPEYFSAATTADGQIMGYVMGKCEGEGELWHGHVSAVTVAPGYRRQGLAK